MSKSKMKRTNLYITEKQHNNVSKDAEERGINFSEMFRKIIDCYYDNKKQ